MSIVCNIVLWLSVFFHGLACFDLFDFILYVPSIIFQCYIGTGLPGLNQYLARINVLAQEHNTVTPVRLEPRPFGLESSAQPLSSCAPGLACSMCIPLSLEYNQMLGYMAVVINCEK